MNIIRRRGWEIPERLATPEHLVFSRRRLLAAGVGAGALALAPRLAAADHDSDAAKARDLTADLYPAKRNPKYTLDRPITDEKVNGNYNNFYEFGTSKHIAKEAQELPIRPWTVTIDGLVEKKQEIGIDDLIRKMTLEERLYRHRCVEAWSMAIAWTGFPLAKLVKFAQPLGSAKFVKMTTFMDPSVATGQHMAWFPWPYVEGLTIAEATNDLAFLATGAYGHPMAQAARRAAAAGGAVEVRLQVDQVDRALHLHRQAADGHVGEAAIVRVRLLCQRQPEGAASALEPGDRGGHRHR